MRPMQLEEIRRAIHGRWIDGQSVAGAAIRSAKDGRGGVVVSGVSTDTRHCRAGDLFFALRGERFRGEDFLAVASKAGCAAAVVTAGADLPDGALDMFPGGLIGVGDTTLALGELGEYHRGLLACTVIGITGSNGKTTCKRMTQHILATRFIGSCSPKSFNNNIGVPLTLLGASPGDQYVICEIGTNSPGEIATLAKMSRPDIAVITSIAPAHLERFGTLAGVAVEKSSLLGSLSAGGIAVVCDSSPELDTALRAYDCRMVRFGESAAADLRLTAYEPTADGMRFQINGRLWCAMPLPGRHNATNALASIAVARRMGLSEEEAVDALADFGGTEMRLERAKAGALTLINDAYNANSGSMLAAGRVLAETAGARRVMIAGDMRELGPAGPRLHEELGGQLAALGVDLLIGVGELGRYIAMGASAAGGASQTFDTVESACASVPALLREGDVVLIKGSRAMAMERLVEPIKSRFGGGQIGG